MRIKINMRVRSNELNGNGKQKAGTIGTVRASFLPFTRTRLPAQIGLCSAGMLSGMTKHMYKGHNGHCPVLKQSILIL